MNITEMITSFSLWQLFKKCRKACYYRYIMGLYAKTGDYKLYFGSLSHDCLKTWYLKDSLDSVLKHIDDKCLKLKRKDYEDDESFKAAKAEAKKTWHYATAMMKAYTKRYPKEPFYVETLEEEFDTEIKGTDFKIKIKADGIIYIDEPYVLDGKEVEEGYYLLEHKTTSSINPDYFEKLWTDLQIVLYSYYMQEVLQVELKGVLYNVLQKSMIKQAMGETQEEFEARRAALLTKSKNGKTMAKRKMPESDTDFQKRLAAEYENPLMFQRKIHVIPPEKYTLLAEELLSLTDDFKRACGSGVFYRNELSCFQFGTPCEFFPLCAGLKKNEKEIIKTAYGVSIDRKERFKQLTANK